MMFGVFTLTPVRTGKVLGEFTCRVHSLKLCRKRFIVKLVLIPELSMFLYFFVWLAAGSNAAKSFVKSEDECIGTQNDSSSQKFQRNLLQLEPSE